MKCNRDGGCEMPFYCLDQVGICMWASSQKTSDPVNHPPHYTKGTIKCIDAMKASCSPEAFQGHLKLAAFKYLWRYEDKGNPLQDLEKAEWYIKRLIKEVKGEV